MGIREASIFDAHIMLLEDEELFDAILSEIEEKHHNAAKATRLVIEQLVSTFNELENEYIRDRDIDLKDVGGRLIANLTGNPNDIIIHKENTVLVVHDLNPFKYCYNWTNARLLLL